MKLLDDHYQEKQTHKKAKKFQIVLMIRKIQKFWRFYIRMKKKILANRIGGWYKELQRNKKSEKMVKKKRLKSLFAARKIQFWWRR